MKQTQNKEIIEEVLRDFVEKHELNLKDIGGWDKNDFLDYSNQLLDKTLQSKQKEMLDEFKKIIDEMYEKKRLSLIELGLPLEDWWGESEIFSFNEIEELKQKLKELK